MNMKHAFRTLALAAAAGLILVTANGQGKKGFGTHLVGKKMVPFKMTDIKGKTWTNASLKGKVVILDFWATWCGPCKMASPTMQKLHEKYAKQGLVVVGADVFEQTDSKAASTGYAKEHKYTYTFTTANDNLAKSLGIANIPAFVFVGRDGKIAKVQTGFGTEIPAKFEATVKDLLAKK